MISTGELLLIATIMLALVLAKSMWNFWKNRNPN